MFDAMIINIIIISKVNLKPLNVNLANRIRLIVFLKQSEIKSIAMIIITLL